jgi:DNA processing protein
LFTDLSNDERIIIQLLEERPHAIDDLCFRSGLSASAIASAILSLELQNLISALPGKIYRVV